MGRRVGRRAIFRHDRRRKKRRRPWKRSASWQLWEKASLSKSIAFRKEMKQKKNERKKEKKKSGRGGVGGGHGRVVAQVRSVNGRVHLRPGVDTKGRYLSGRVGSGFVSFAFFFATAAIVRPCAACDSENERWPAVVTHFSEAKVGALEQQEAGRLVGRNPCVKNSCFSTWRQRPSVSRR